MVVHLLFNSVGHSSVVFLCRCEGYAGDDAHIVDAVLRYPGRPVQEDRPRSALGVYSFYLLVDSILYPGPDAHFICDLDRFRC